MLPGCGESETAAGSDREERGTSLIVSQLRDSFARERIRHPYCRGVAGAF